MLKNILYWSKYSTDFDKICIRNTMNHDCYPPKILCKSDMILIGFSNLKIVKVFLLEKSIKDRGRTLTGLSISILVLILAKSPIILFSVSIYHVRYLLVYRSFFMRIILIFQLLITTSINNCETGVKPKICMISFNEAIYSYWLKRFEVFCRTLMGIKCFDIIINLDSYFGL